jgi:hypothetical protein
MKGEREMRVIKRSKILALALSLAMLICAMPMMASAEEPAAPISIDEVSVVDAGEGLLDVTVSYTTTEEAGDQITILATVSTDEITSDNANNIIAYIDQFARADATGEFTFKMDSDKLLDSNVYVKMGGTNVASPAEMTGTFTETSDGVKVFGYVTVPGATVSLGDQETETDENGYFEFVNVSAGSYTITIDKRGAIARTVAVTVADADVAVSEEDDEIELIMGNFYTDDDDGLPKINVYDLTVFLNNFGKTTQDDDYDEMFNLYTDDDDGLPKINVYDLTVFLNNFGKTSADYDN